MERCTTSSAYNISICMLACAIDNGFDIQTACIDDQKEGEK